MPTNMKPCRVFKNESSNKKSNKKSSVYSAYHFHSCDDFSHLIALIRNRNNSIYESNIIHSHGNSN